jgi:hypothetical protein
MVRNGSKWFAGAIRAFHAENMIPHHPGLRQGSFPMTRHGILPETAYAQGWRIQVPDRGVGPDTEHPAGAEDARDVHGGPKPFSPGGDILHR